MSCLLQIFALGLSNYKQAIDYLTLHRCKWHTYGLRIIHTYTFSTISLRRDTHVTVLGNRTVQYKRVRMYSLIRLCIRSVVMTMCVMSDNVVFFYEEMQATMSWHDVTNVCYLKMPSRWYTIYPDSRRRPYFLFTSPLYLTHKSISAAYYSYTDGHARIF